MAATTPLAATVAMWHVPITVSLPGEDVSLKTGPTVEHIKTMLSQRGAAKGQLRVFNPDGKELLGSQRLQEGSKLYWGLDN